jgi:hypothetical protein
MARGGHGLSKVSPGPAMPYPNMPCRWDTPKRALRLFQSCLPAERAACSCLLSFWTPIAVPLCLIGSKCKRGISRENNYGSQEKTITKIARINVELSGKRFHISIDDQPLTTLFNLLGHNLRRLHDISAESKTLTHKHGRMARASHGLPKVSPRPSMPNPSTPCGQATLGMALHPFQGWPTHRAGNLQPSSTLLDTPCPTPMPINQYIISLFSNAKCHHLHSSKTNDPKGTINLQ